jgi:quinol monooxygenase YgiN
MLRGEKKEYTMVTVIATLKVKSGSEAAFETAAQEMIAHVKANEPGTLTYVFHRAAGDPTQFAVYEVYTDQTALAAHSSSETLQKFFGTIGGMLDGRPAITMYEQIGGKA